MLIKIVKGRKKVRRSLSKLKVSRSKRSGFSEKRYLATDPKYPVIIDKDDVVLDGRHRLCKLYDQGRKFAQCVIATEKEIEKCRIQNQ